jgi:hypothetical protein
MYANTWDLTCIAPDRLPPYSEPKPLAGGGSRSDQSATVEGDELQSGSVRRDHGARADDESDEGNGCAARKSTDPPLADVRHRTEIFPSPIGKGENLTYARAT